jgi:hypothetical protein
MYAAMVGVRSGIEAERSAMTTRIDVFYDFRSPYAFFASHRIRRGDFVRSDVGWRWQPVSIDILLNLQAGRESFAPYVDPLSGPKRATDCRCPPIGRLWRTVASDQAAKAQFDPCAAPCR